MAQNHAIGIDLGTSYTKVAVVLNGEVKIIHNEEGGKTSIPSCVCFSKNNVLIGHRAQERSVTEPENSIFDVKRIIGRKYNDPALKNDMKKWPFEVINANNEPRIKVKGNIYYPEDISAMILKEVKRSAEQYLDGKKVTNAVITVPAHFSDSQLNATKNAAEMAELKVLELLVEPTAAALAYGLERKSETIGIRRVFVFDFGGGTMDASLLEVQGTDFKVLAIEGDPNMGGIDLDNNLAEYIKEQFRKKNKSSQPLNSKEIRRLTLRCEAAKISLSISNETTIDLPNVSNDIDIVEVVTRKQFELQNDEIFKKLMGIVTRILERAGVAKSQVDDIILVGGSSLVPKVKELVQEFFDGTALYKNPNPNEAVVKGAAIRAWYLTGGTLHKDINLQNVLPLSIGIEDHFGAFQRILKRNTQVPATVTKILRTSAANQKMVLIPVYEGENELAKENIYLGKLIIRGLPPGREGEVKFEIKFSVDKNRILQASVVEQGTGNQNKVTLELKKTGLSEKQMKKMYPKMKSTLN